MIKSIIALLVIAPLMGGCAGWGCDGWEKFSPSRKDTEGTKAQALKHNDFGRKQGCWK